MSTKNRATIDDLFKLPDNGKAEIVNGEILLMSPTGDLPNSAAGAIYASLREFARATGRGRAYTDNIGYKVNLPDRDSFSPDASYYIGPRTGGKFLLGTPVFAVEVRSGNDYGDKAEEQIAKKRADYFKAGTGIVWDVDVLKDEVIRSYRANDPDNPTIFCRGEIANAEPAVPGWSIPVDELFE
jgi:Uma2 family endonuclease